MSTESEIGVSASFAPALLDSDMDIPKHVVGPDGNPSTKRFNVYRNNVVTSLMTAMKQAYPSLYSLLGDEKFSTLARAYINKFPPRSAMMQVYGSDFPRYLADLKPLENSPFLVELAYMEKAWQTAYHASDDMTLQPDMLAEIPSEHVGDAIFSSHSALHLQSSEFPLFDLFGRRFDESDDINLEHSQSVLITRPQLNVEVRQLERAELEFFVLLQQGTTLGQAIAGATEFATEIKGNFDPSTAIGTLLESGAFSSLTLTTPSHDER